MVPAAIGSERKRHMPTPTTVVSPMPIIDWSSVSKRKSIFYFLLFKSIIVLLEPYPYPQQQQQPPPQQQQQQQQQQQTQQQTRDYPR
jgi:hypothetical protein